MKTTFALLTLASAQIASAESPYPLPQATRIDFISIGTGIDFEAAQRALAVAEAAQEDGILADFQQVSWGMEGELTICVQGKDSEANARLAEEFRFLEQARYVKVSYPRGCRNLSLPF